MRNYDQVLPNRKINHSKPYIPKRFFFRVIKIFVTKQLEAGTYEKKFFNALKKYLHIEGDFVFQESGTKALEQVLNWVKIKNDKRKIIIPTYVCPEVLTAVVNAGCIPITVDVDDNGFIDYFEVQKKMDNDVLGVIFCQLFGRISSLENFEDLNVFKIEDSCQNFDDSMLSADFRVYSFGPTKMLSNLRGGLIVANRLSKFNSANLSEDFFSNSKKKLNEVEAALGLSQIEVIQKNLKRRKKIAGRYQRAGLRERLGKGLLKNQNFRYVIIEELPFEIIRETLSKSGVEVRKGVDTLLHRILELNDEDFPNAVRLFQQSISLPIYPSLSWFCTRKIIKEFNKIRNQGA